MAVFVPFATAATLLSWYCGAAVSARAVWCWVQVAGKRAMEQLEAPWEGVARGHGPTPEPLEADLAALPLAMGADGVMVPFRPMAGQAMGKTRWREIKVGVLARLGRQHTRPGRDVVKLCHRLVKSDLGGHRGTQAALVARSPAAGYRGGAQGGLAE